MSQSNRTIVEENETTPLIYNRNQNATKSNYHSDYLIPVSRRGFWLMFAPILLGYFIAMFDNYLMSTSHPVITSYFNASNSASWLSTAFMLTSTASQPIFGRLSDTIGRRPVYIGSIAAFTVATAWCGLAQSIQSFIAARAFGGVAAGGMASMAGIITNDLVRIEVRGTYQAYINLLYGGGAACGATFGGALCDALGWRWTFAIQIPLILLIFVCAIVNVPSNLGPQLARNSDLPWWKILSQFDLSGSLFLTLAVGFLILGLNLGGNILPWQHPLVIFFLCAAVVAGIALIAIERRAHRPVMPLVFLTTAPRANLIFANFVSMIGINHVIFNAPLFFQAVHGETPTVSGVRMGVATVMTTFFGVSTGFFITYTGRIKMPQLAGGASMLIGGVALAMMQVGTPCWLATVFVSPAGIGQGLMFPATTISVLAVTEAAETAAIISSITLFRNLGMVMGVATSSLIMQNTLLALLKKSITGDDREVVIRKLRESVRAILDLKGQQREQAVQAYADALKWVFISSIVCFVLAILLVMPAKLPWLGREKVAADVDSDDENENEDGNQE